MSILTEPEFYPKDEYNEKDYFKDIVRTKEPDLEKKVHKEKANVERD